MATPEAWSELLPLGSAETVGWSDGGTEAPWRLRLLDDNDMPPPVPKASRAFRPAAFCSAGLHFAAFVLVAMGLPHIDLDWLALRTEPVTRVDVVFYTPSTAEVAPGEGSVSQEQSRLSLGAAERRGLDVGANPSPLSQDPRRDAHPASEAQGHAGTGLAPTDETASIAVAATARKQTNPSGQSAGAENSRAAPASSRPEQHSPRSTADSSPDGAEGKPEGKKDQSAGIQDRSERKIPDDAKPSAAASTEEATEPPERQLRPTPLAASLPVLDGQEAEAKIRNPAAMPLRSITVRLQLADMRPTASSSSKESQGTRTTESPRSDPLLQSRPGGGQRDLKLLASASTEEPVLPASGANADAVPGSMARNTPTSETKSTISPVRSAQAMPAPAADRSANVAMKLMLQTMPGLDSQLAAAIASPESVPELPPTPRREQVIVRMKKAAAQGYAHAQYGLARRELIGQGVKRDPQVAAELLEHAARQGYPTAQLALGYLALKGYGVKQDKAEATLWLTLAASQGNDDAARGLALIEPTLTPQELMTARRLTSEWRAVMGEVATARAAPVAEGKAAPERAPLQDAVLHGDITAVRTLVARGEDANGRDREGRTAMINAGWRGDGPMVENLLDLGADPDVVDNEGRTAIMWAAGNGYPNVVERLIKAGVELDLQDKEGRTALVRAALNGHADVVKALVAGKANLNLRDDHGKTALDYALRQDYPDIVQALEKAGAKR